MEHGVGCAVGIVVGIEVEGTLLGSRLGVVLGGCIGSDVVGRLISVGLELGMLDIAVGIPDGPLETWLKPLGCAEGAEVGDLVVR